MSKAAAPLDVAITGVPKAGTSSLFYWLAVHPQIQATRPKETSYFVDPDQASARTSRFSLRGWAGFEEFFDGPATGRKRLEGTAINLFQHTARVEFARLESQPLILVILRCPAEQIRSGFYFHQHATRIDPALSFEDYVHALVSADHEVFERTMPYPDVRENLERSMERNRYAHWLDLWREDFSADRVMVLTLEQLSRDPCEVLSRIYSRLGLAPHEADAAALVPRNATSARTIAAPGRLARLGRRVVPRGRMRDRLAAWDRHRRTGGLLGGPSEHEETVLRDLGRCFAESDRDLETRYGVNVSRWWSSGNR